MNSMTYLLSTGATWALSMVSAIAVVLVSFECRILADELMQLRMQEQRLQVEWGKLLLEESALATHARLEDVALQQLGMRRPRLDEVRVVLP